MHWELELGEPGEQLGQALPDPEQDVAIAALMRRLWAHQPGGGEPFGSLAAMCDPWAEWFELEFDQDSQGLNPGLARYEVTAAGRARLRAERRFRAALIGVLARSR